MKQTCLILKCFTTSTYYRLYSTKLYFHLQGEFHELPWCSGSEWTWYIKVSFASQGIGSYWVYHVASSPKVKQSKATHIHKIETLRSFESRQYVRDSIGKHQLDQGKDHHECFLDRQARGCDISLSPVHINTYQVSSLVQGCHPLLWEKWNYEIMGGQTAAWLEVKSKRQLYEPWNQRGTVQVCNSFHIFWVVCSTHTQTQGKLQALRCWKKTRSWWDDVRIRRVRQRERESNYLRSMPITGNWLSGTMSFIGRHKLLSRGDWEK